MSDIRAHTTCTRWLTANSVQGKRTETLQMNKQQQAKLPKSTVGIHSTCIQQMGTTFMRLKYLLFYKISLIAVLIHNWEGAEYHLQPIHQLVLHTNPTKTCNIFSRLPQIKCFLHLIGRGVFAMRPIDPGDFVLEYRGELLTQEECQSRSYSENESTFLFDFEWQNRSMW